MRLYLKNENCTRKGAVVNQIDDNVAAEVDACETSDDEACILEDYGIHAGDCHYHDGTEDELIAYARESLAIQQSIEPRCNQDRFAILCARRILEWFDVETVWDDKTARYVVKIDTYYIEAADDDHEWDSDYVGSESYEIDEALQYLDELRARETSDPENDDECADGVSWRGWSFRLCGFDERGRGCPVDEDALRSVVEKA